MRETWSYRIVESCMRECSRNWRLPEESVSVISRCYCEVSPLSVTAGVDWAPGTPRVPRDRAPFRASSLRLAEVWGWGSRASPAWATDCGNDCRHQQRVPVRNRTGRVEGLQIGTGKTSRGIMYNTPTWPIMYTPSTLNYTLSSHPTVCIVHTLTQIYTYTPLKPVAWINEKWDEFLWGRCCGLKSAGKEKIS